MASSFSRQRNPNMEKAQFDWPIVLQYDVKAKYRLISRKFSGMTFFHPSVCLTNQITVSARLLFLFCSRVFISRSYENSFNKLHCFPFICVCLIRLFSQWIPRTRMFLLVSMSYSMKTKTVRIKSLFFQVRKFLTHIPVTCKSLRI